MDPRISARNIFLSFCLFLFLAVCPLSAQTSAVIRLVDGRVQKIAVETLTAESPDKVTFHEVKSKRTTEFRSAEIWQIEFTAQPIARGSMEQVWLHDGSRISGRLSRWVEFPVRPAVQSDLFRELAVWDDAIIGLTRTWHPPPHLPIAPPEKDLLCTTDGDQMVGRFHQLDPSSIGFRSDLGNITCLREKMSALVLAPRKPTAAKDKDTPWALVFANGDRVRTHGWAIESGRLRCAVMGNNPPAAASLLQRAVFLGETAEPFSTIQPQRFSMNPLLAGTRAILVDRSPGGGALRVGNREYLFGLHLQPECELEYALGPAHVFFVCELGLSASSVVPQSAIGAPQSARARLLFAVGDQDWRTYSVCENSLPTPIILPLSGAQRLRIRVEAADDWGAGAHVVLGEPLLVKKAGK